MWWWLKKLYDDEKTVIYEYGCETRVLTGKISFNRETQQFEILKIADNDTKHGADILLPHLYRVIIKEGCPNERQIATG